MEDAEQVIARAAHTPGPWGAWPLNGSSPFGITGLAAAAALVATAAVGECRFVRKAVVIQIASRSKEAPALAFGNTAESACANARLIAAAPELLEALTDLVNATFEDGDGYVRDLGDVLDRRLLASARAAISKATGGN